ncbi:FAD-dependent oxidoreductase [Croceicoccus sp. F390]|uniref:FAD-dependent oxidoreductase n=1 Tax=Croceicoccus esteveae TaxID=3075597 RepID=A0ABU2ZE30_9SPHN|nr:FAD-dependent oxidoreductase [Croceicoccus sp. F390]MDT0574858.1 FAD-dependent oxidoreductase [Croceicoccus sp. F390]
MRHIAIIGSGPAGYYTAEAALKHWGDAVRIDVFDRLPVPYGLIRAGVAPDHQTIKHVASRYEKTAMTGNVRFVGHIDVGKDVTVAELQELYHAVVLATGAPHDRPLTIPGSDLAGVYGSAQFVGWYNGHPQFAGLKPDLSSKTAVLIGNGNVALDIARILAKTREEFTGSDIIASALDQLASSALDRIVLLGRRGPHQIAMTPKELGELGRLERAVPIVTPADLPPQEEDDALEPGQRKSVALLREFASARNDSNKPVKIEFNFFSAPVQLIGDDRVEAVEVERTRLDGGRAVGTGEVTSIPCGLVVSAIGYRSMRIAGVPFDDRLGRIANEDGRVAPGLYCVGWARRGPTGTIGTNKPDGFGIVKQIAADLDNVAAKEGREGFDRLVAERALNIVTFKDWKRIEEAEKTAARSGSPREKFTDVDDMIRAVQAQK